MRKVALIAGAVVVAVGAVFAVGVFVFHWFVVGEERWMQLTLPVAEAEQRVGPVEEFPAVVEAQERLDLAGQVLVAAEVALTEARTTAEVSLPNPGGMPEKWQGWWCLLRGRLGLLTQVGSDLRFSSGPPPYTTSYSEWANWAFAHEAEFYTLCSEVLAGQAPTLTEDDKAVLVSEAVDDAVGDQRSAVEEARLGTQRAEAQLRAAIRSYDVALNEEVAALVRATGSGGAGESEERIRASLLDAEWVFCDLNEDKTIAAAVSLGFLPENPEGDLPYYWWVTRPDEYIRACKAAFSIG